MSATPRADHAALQFPHVVADAGEPLQAALAVEEVLHLRRAHAFLREEIQHHAGIELAGRVPIGKAVERRKAHRAFNALPAVIAHIEAPLPRWATITRPPAISGATSGSRFGNIFIGKAVESVTPDALRMKLVGIAMIGQRS